jgi:predicted DNA-binding protein
MAAKNPRVVAVLERPLYQRLREAAKAEGVSLSTKVRDLIREAMELEEDTYSAAEGERRLASFDRRKALSHREVWG